MDWRDLQHLTALRAFAALAAEGGAGAAAAALNVSHSAISQQIRALEAELGAKLTRREGRGLSLTDDGEALARVLIRSFGDIAAEVDRLKRADAVRALRITAPPSFAANWLMPKLPAFRRAHPEIEIAIAPTAELQQVGPGGADLAIRFGRGGWPGVDSHLLIAEAIAVVGRAGDHPGGSVDSIDALRDLPWLQEPGAHEIAGWLAARGVDDASARILAIPGALIVDAARRGEGVTAQPMSAVAAGVADGSLAVLYREAAPGYGYHLLTDKRGAGRASARFARWLKAETAG